MRGTPTGLGTPYPLASLLPAVLQEDELLMRFAGAMDQVLAPAIAGIDCLPAYIDPWLTPPDHLPRLAGWVGIELDETWTVGRQRAAVAQAVAMHRGRGTVAGLRQLVELAGGGEVVIEDSGGVRWSLEPVDDEEPAAARLTVVIRGTTMSAAALSAVVDAAKPAHVVHDVRVEPLVTGDR